MRVPARQSNARLWWFPGAEGRFWVEDKIGLGVRTTCLQPLMTAPESSQYAAAAYAPLIKNPSLRVQPPVRELVKAALKR